MQTNNRIVQMECGGETLSLEDATVLGYTRSATSVTVRLSLWDSRRVLVSFAGAIGVYEVLASDLSFVRQMSAELPTADGFVSDSMREHYGAPGGRVSVFEFVDPEDRVSLRIICAGDSSLSARWHRRGED